MTKVEKTNKPIIEMFSHLSSRLVVVFVVRDFVSETEYTVRNGTDVKAQLKEKLRKQGTLIGFKVAKVDTVGKWVVLKFSKV